jgi:putative ABC transport system permease protein
MAPRNGGEWSTGARVNGTQQIQFAIETVNENYLDVMGIKLLEGRNFNVQMPTDSTESVIVNESFVKQAGWNDPLGREVDFFWAKRKAKVIGVVADHHYSDLLQPIGPQLLTMNPENQYGTALIRIKAGSETTALPVIASIFRSNFPFEPYHYAFREDQNREAYEQEEKWKQLFLFSTAISIFIACIGLFGLSVLNAERRTREIGIRKVLGASVVSVITRLSVEFLVLVGIALIIGIPIAWFGARNWLSNYPYRFDPGLNLVFTTIFIILFVAVSTVFFQALRAALANPVKSLRIE